MYNDDDCKLKKRETDGNIFKEECVLITNSNHLKRCVDALERIATVLESMDKTGLPTYKLD